MPVNKLACCLPRNGVLQGGTHAYPGAYGVRGLMACGQKPLTLTLSRWERGQETVTKKVIINSAINYRVSRGALAVVGR